MQRIYGWWSLPLVLCFSAVSSAQQAQPARPAATAANAGTSDAKAATADEQLAAVMLAGCRHEIELAIAAKPLLKSEAAKDFADKIMQDHQASCDKLEKIAGSHARPARTAPAPGGEQKAQLQIGKLKLEATTVGPREGEPARSASPLSWIAIQEEMGDECLELAKAELKRNEHYIDETFIGQQIAGHMQMIAQLKTFHKYASGTLRGQIDSNREMAEQHLKEAKGIMESLAKETGSKP